MYRLSICPLKHDLMAISVSSVMELLKSKIFCQNSTYRISSYSFHRNYILKVKFEGFMKCFFLIRVMCFHFQKNKLNLNVLWSVLKKCLGSFCYLMVVLVCSFFLGENKDTRRCFLRSLQVSSNSSLLFNIVFWSAVRIMSFSWVCPLRINYSDKDKDLHASFVLLYWQKLGGQLPCPPASYAPENLCIFWNLRCFSK